jgi:hypothetical protein
MQRIQREHPFQQPRTEESREEKQSDKPQACALFKDKDQGEPYHTKALT